MTHRVVTEFVLKHAININLAIKEILNCIYRPTSQKMFLNK